MIHWESEGDGEKVGGMKGGLYDTLGEGRGWRDGRRNERRVVLNFIYFIQQLPKGVTEITVNVYVFNDNDKLIRVFFPVLGI